MIRYIYTLFIDVVEVVLQEEAILSDQDTYRHISVLQCGRGSMGNKPLLGWGCDLVTVTSALIQDTVCWDA